VTVVTSFLFSRAAPVGRLPGRRSNRAINIGNMRTSRNKERRVVWKDLFHDAFATGGFILPFNDASAVNHCYWARSFLDISRGKVFGLLLPSRSSSHVRLTFPMYPTKRQVQYNG